MPYQNIRLIEVGNRGQIGAGKVVPFPSKKSKTRIVRPENTSVADVLFTHTVCGESLIDPLNERLAVYNGDTLICKGNFNIWDVTPNKICIVFILPTCEQVAKKVIYDKSRNLVILRSANPNYKDRFFSENDIEIKGIVVTFQRNFNY